MKKILNYLDNKGINYILIDLFLIIIGVAAFIDFYCGIKSPWQIVLQLLAIGSLYFGYKQFDKTGNGNFSWVGFIIAIVLIFISGILAS